MTLDVDLLVGHLYQLKPTAGDLSTCVGIIEDITGSSAATGEDSRTGGYGRPVELQTRAQTQPVIDEWENLALYRSPPAHYEVIGIVAGDAGGFRLSASMKDAMEGMKKPARMMGATGVLVVIPGEIWGPERVTPPVGTGAPIYGADSAWPTYWQGVSIVGLAIYVPADLEAFQKAAQVHATLCIALTQKKDAAKDAYKAVKGNGTPADVAAAKQAEQAAEDASDAAYCGDDDWYAEQMTGQKQ